MKIKVNETINEGKLYNYCEYEFSRSEYTKYVVFAFCIIVATGYLFFKNLYIIAVICGFSLIYPKLILKSKIKKQKDILTLQFKEALLCISSSLSAGRSLITAFTDVPSELSIIYPDKNDFIIQEFENVKRKISLNQTIEYIFDDFASRADIESVTNFSEILKICGHTGGNLNEVIKNTTSIIIEKIEIQNEINVLTSEQKLSIKLLTCIPFVIIFLISSTSSDYIAPLYSPLGNLVMFTVGLIILFSYYIGKKVIEIEV